MAISPHTKVAADYPEDNIHSDPPQNLHESLSKIRKKIETISNSNFDSISSSISITNLNSIPTRLHNDLQSRSAIASHPSEAVGVLSPSSLFPQDIGKNWKDTGKITVGSQRIMAITYLGNGIAIAGTNTRRIHRTVDYGNNWADLGIIGTSGQMYLSSYIGNGIVIIGDSNKHIFRSTDFGLTWTDLGQVSSSFIGAIIYLGNGIVIITSSNPAHIIRSTDFGLTWTDTGQISTNSIVAITYLGNGIVITTENTEGHIFRSTDFGLTWNDLGVIITPAGGNPTKASYLGNGVVIISDARKIFRSTDFGLTWTDLGFITALGKAIFSLVNLGNGVTIIGEQDGRIYRSTDYGATWINLGIIASDTAEALEYCSNGIVLLGSDDGHIYKGDIAYKTDESQANQAVLTTTKSDIGYSGCQIIHSTIAAVQLSSGVAVYLNATGQADLALASASGTIPCIGVISSGVPSGKTCYIINKGHQQIPNISGAINNTLYLSELSAGMLTQVRPSTGFIQRIGVIAVNLSNVLINPDPFYYNLSGFPQ